MDVLESLLDGPRARGAFLLRAVLDPPWSLRILDESPLTVLAVIRGGACVIPDDAPAQRLAAGDVAITRGPDPYTIADEPDTAPTVVVYPGQRCTDPKTGRSLADELSLGVRTWGESRAGETVLLVGSYEHAGDVSRPLLSALPQLLTLTRHEWDSPLVSLLADEMTRDGPGQRAVLDRLLDVLLMAALRTWFERQADAAPAWFRAQADPIAGVALELLQRHPAHPWTVAKLAAEVGVSRAALARRFTALVGEPPMAYLTSWRLALAADLLCRSDVTVDAVARQVGYGSAFALSAAFKRERGVSPQQHRTLVTSA